MRQWPAWLLGFTDILEAVNAAARTAYRLGLCKSERAAVPVISVGNIACGGTGKTPLVAALARTLLSAGARPAILTRGYRRRASQPVLLWQERQASWEQAGDEPALLARALPDVPIVVDPDRVRGAATAVRETGATHLLLDDGFQHWRLARDLDIVLVDATDPFGGGHLAPWGRLREGPRALARAGVVIITRADMVEPEELKNVEEQIARHAPNAVRAQAWHKVAGLRSVPQGELRPLHELRGMKVHALSGIGNPEGFKRTLARLGANVVGATVFRDHHRYTREEAEDLEALATDKEDVCVITTAKDAAKLSPFYLTGEDLPLFCLEIEFSLVQGGDAVWNKVEQALGAEDARAESQPAKDEAAAPAANADAPGKENEPDRPREE